MEIFHMGLPGGMKALLLVAGLVALGGCITIKAPEDKIVIELNINIKQEVLYKIENQVQDTIEQNQGIF
ncbi:YnbE family lipoprotein [Altererythrobacter sp. CC-YST694]|uniref:YnbE family lipoprotein n=1 Tax=Altererythrobacter sp. CC-YST694 TaxID=2755038 RepID=UPI001D02E8AC|nr:YnbE family lipoprotein [Altererythrobacter sp. CC-YST694]